jgi:hypothetical protein
LPTIPTFFLFLAFASNFAEGTSETQQTAV